MPKTLRATSSNRLSIKKASLALRSERGFSLIEILIVISLVVLMTTIGIPSLNNAFRTSNDSYARRMAVSLREARDRAMLTDKLVRFRIDFEKQETWFEEAPSSYLRAKASAKGLSERDREEKEKKEEGAFRLVKELTPEKQKLPNGLKITEIAHPRFKSPLKEGIADVYFYANGSTDGVRIFFETDEGVKQKIILHPVTGQSKLELGGAEE